MLESYDLRKERWIDFVKHDGTFGREGLCYLLRNGPEIKDIVDQSPLVKLSVYRLLIAIVHWLHPMDDRHDWLRIWSKGKFPAEVIETLESEKADCFDLFDPNHPFCQAPSATEATQAAQETDATHAGPDTKAKEEADWATASNLAIEIPAGTAVNHFWHAYDLETALCPACCAKGLILLPPFCGQGGSGKHSSINPELPLYVLQKGRNLVQTILLSLPERKTDGDAPRWKWSEAKGAGEIGLLEGFTWQPRRVKLPPPTEGACTRCGARGAVCTSAVFLAGRSRDSARKWTDPHVPLVAGLKTAGNPAPKPKSIRPRSTTSFWLNVAGAILQPPATGNRFAPEPDMVDRVEWFWTVTKGPKYCDWDSEEWSAPCSELTQQNLLKRIRSALRKPAWSKKKQARPAFGPEFDRRTERHFARLLHDAHAWPAEAAALVKDFEKRLDDEAHDYGALCDAKPPHPSAPPKRTSIPRCFVDELAALGPNNLSLLKTATGKRLGSDVAVWDLFHELIRPFPKIVFDRWAYYLVATLYPWHPQQNGQNSGKSLGAALRDSAKMRPQEQKRIDQRMDSLRHAHAAGLDALLLKTVRELSQQGIGFSWATLLRDLTKWNRASRPTQREWSSEYFTATKKKGKKQC